MSQIIESILQSARNASHEGYSKDDRTIIFSSTAVGALLTVIFVTQALQYIIIQSINVP
ncbi:unnamed protein product [Brugia timori]|uniref:DUF2970 domain-containing protein n=1 Tax=Brugia timori TaxID=42155 RepID=A0A0R3QFR3_9BILA|nr:unnamed protein product [Brugia timori]